MAASIRSLRVCHFPRQAVSGVSSAWRIRAECRQSSTTTVLPSVDDADLPLSRKFDSDAESLAARGYLRSQKPYDPPADVASQVTDICKRVLPNCNASTALRDTNTKFKVLAQCSQAIGHTVPNSLLHQITNVGELVTFYQTKVDTSFPLDGMKTQDLPKNLHVIHNYTRFHPETDTMFGGVSVFTKDSTIVTGLKAKKKYPGYIKSQKWPYE